MVKMQGFQPCHVSSILTILIWVYSTVAMQMVAVHLYLGSIPNISLGCMAQQVEHFSDKEEVASSSLVTSIGRIVER